MTKTETPLKTPSPANSLEPRKVGSSPTTVFIGMALDMSWRLAIAVLVPIIGGALLDRRFKTSPVLLIVGFIIAMAGMTLVMWQTLRAAENITITKKDKRP